jgi:hypothetical protein
MLSRILVDDSQLLELWQDSDDLQAWQTSMDRLKSAVRV